MYDLHFWPTPNGWKITTYLEEAGLPYRVVPVDIAKGEQFRPEFLAISPNNRMPALVDHDPEGGGEPLAVFESGAILTYLGEKTGKFLPKDPRGRFAALQWTFWQMAGFGPMTGQAWHFKKYAPERIEYATDRYGREVARLLGVLDGQLSRNPWVAGDELTIADMAIYPWLKGAATVVDDEDLAKFPSVARWAATMKARPAIERGMAVGKELTRPEMTAEEKAVLFGIKPKG